MRFLREFITVSMVNRVLVDMLGWIGLRFLTYSSYLLKF